MKAIYLSLLLLTASLNAQTYTPDGKQLLLPIEQVTNIWLGLQQGKQCEIENIQLRQNAKEANQAVIDMAKEFEAAKKERAQYREERDNALSEAWILESEAKLLRATPKVKHWSFGPSIQYGFDGKKLCVSVGGSLQYSLIRF